jgi:hypothetical protein
VEGCAKVVVQVMQATPQHKWMMVRDQGDPLVPLRRDEATAGRRPRIRFVP